MQMQVMTQQMQAYSDYYDGKNGRSFSVTVMQPVNIAVELSPMKGNAVKDMEDTMAKAKDDGLQVQLDFQNAVDNWGKPKMVVYDVKLAKPQAQTGKTS